MDIKDLLTGGGASHPIWDRYCPIVTDKNHTDIYLADEIAEPSNYNEMCHVLRSASRAETFTLHINTPGGLLDSAIAIIDAIKASKAKVTASITGTVASAGTIIALACDKIEMADHSSWMSHNYSGGAYGKGHEMKARQEFTDRTLNKSFREIHKGFFTDDEIESIIEGKDIWMGKEEVLERWKNRSIGTAKLNKPSE